MHIPDGFLSLEVSAAMYVVAAFFWVLAFRRAKKVVGDRHKPLLAVLSAAIFAGQMLNFTLVGLGGTSGHLLGAALAAIILGPYSALIIMTLVLVVQALFFGDGGITALGANVVNMGIIAGFTAYAVYSWLKKMIKSVYINSFAAAWASVVVASFICALQLGLSRTIDTQRAVIAMVPIHAAIGIGEGLITAAVLIFIQRSRPDLLKLRPISPRWFK